MPCEIFSQEGQKVRRFDGSPRHSARNADQTGGGSANPQSLAFCSRLLFF
jgi:hypothetical protein